MLADLIMMITTDCEADMRQVWWFDGAWSSTYYHRWKLTFWRMFWGLLVWQNLYEILRFIQQDPGSRLCEGPILPVWGSHSAQYTFTSSDTLSLSPIIMCFYTGGSRLHALRRSDLTSMRLSLGLHFHFLPYDCVFIQVDPSSRLCESPILPVCLIGGERGERSMTKLKLSFEQSFENSFTSSPKYLEI